MPNKIKRYTSDIVPFDTSNSKCQTCPIFIASTEGINNDKEELHRRRNACASCSPTSGAGEYKYDVNKKIQHHANTFKGTGKTAKYYGLYGEAVLNLLNEDKTYTVIAATLGISIWSVQMIVDKLRKDGRYHKLKRIRGYKSRVIHDTTNTADDKQIDTRLIDSFPKSKEKEKEFDEPANTNTENHVYVN